MSYEILTSQEPIPQKYLDRTGERYHETVIIGFKRVFVTNNNGKQFQSIYKELKCDCGLVQLIPANVKRKCCRKCYYIKRKASEQKYSHRVGEQIGHVTLIGFTYQKVFDKNANKDCERLRFRYRCDCGNEGICELSKIPNSCMACSNSKYKKLSHILHGKSKTPEYISWKAAVNRCYNPNDPAFCNYGGRKDPGPITMCDRWLEPLGQGFLNFLDDMGERPTPKENYSIDRINNDLGYFKENCKWSTNHEQMMNQRPRSAPYKKNCVECDSVFFTAYPNKVTCCSYGCKYKRYIRLKKERILL